MCAALAGGRILATFVFGISERDPVTYIAAVVLLGAVAMCASISPALTATRFEPMSVLREE